MALFRPFLLILLIILIGYTAVVVAHYGLNFWPTAFADIARLQWPGQFDVDFLMMLALSGLWVSWRHRFTASGLGLGLLAFLGGALFLTAYLLVLSLQTKGDVRAMLVGKR